MSAAAKLKLNLKPGVDLTLPQVNICYCTNSYMYMTLLYVHDVIVCTRQGLQLLIIMKLLVVTACMHVKDQSFNYVLCVCPAAFDGDRV